MKIVIPKDDSIPYVVLDLRKYARGKELESFRMLRKKLDNNFGESNQKDIINKWTKFHSRFLTENYVFVVSKSLFVDENVKPTAENIVKAITEERLRSIISHVDALPFKNRSVNLKEVLLKERMFAPKIKILDGKHIDLEHDLTADFIEAVQTIRIEEPPKGKLCPNIIDLGISKTKIMVRSVRRNKYPINEKKQILRYATKWASKKEFGKNEIIGEEDSRHRNFRESFGPNVKNNNQRTNSFSNLEFEHTQKIKPVPDDKEIEKDY